MGTYRRTAPIVYVFSSSPSSIAVMLTIKHLEIEVDLVEVTMATGEHLTPHFLKVNPQHTVPTLDDNGYVLTDSHVIMTYLVEMYGKDGSLYPSSNAKLKAMVDQRLHFNSGTLQSKSAKILANHYMQCCQYHKRLAEIIFKCNTSTSLEYDTQTILDCYGMLDKFVVNQQFMACDRLTIADLAIITTVLATSVLVGIDHVRFPNLTRWINLMESMPHHELVENGIDDTRSLLHSK